MVFVATHCHPHFDDFLPDVNSLLARAKTAGVSKMICVGVSLDDSRKAAVFAAEHNLWAAAGVHPHEAKDFNETSKKKLAELLNAPKVVAAGEMGLDYYRLHSSKEDQQSALRAQIEISQSAKLPLIFHVRDAWSDFWQIFDNYRGLTGVIHSFTGGP